MSQNLQEILEIFYKICEIPHPSGKTADLQKFIIDFLKHCDCKVQIDSAGNIHALKGVPKLVFQAHYDMVLVGDKVTPFIENGFLKSRNSSLGADNGIALALLLHLANRRQNFEILLTNDEEIGMLGAKNLALQTQSKMMINLDSECVDEICVGCAGGFDGDVSLIKFLQDSTVGNSPLGLHSADLVNCHKARTQSPLSLCQFTKNHESQTENPSVVDSAQGAESSEKNPSLLDSAKSQNLTRKSRKIAESTLDSASPFKKFFATFLLIQKSRIPPLPLKPNLPNDADSALHFYEFSAQNFKGGHSGIDIHKNIKNAIVELLFALDSASKICKFEILEISGGEARNSIPINARAIIATNAPINIPHFAESTPHIAIKKLEKIPKILQKSLNSAVVAHLLRLHNGIYEMQEGSVISSLNFSQICQSSLKIMVRANSAELLNRQIARLKYLFLDTLKISGFYNAWEENIAESSLFNAVSSIYKKHKIPFRAVQIHAGLECGILKQKCGLSEVLSIGPSIFYPHSKGEMMDLKSFERFCAVVEDLC